MNLRKRHPPSPRSSSPSLSPPPPPPQRQNKKTKKKKKKKKKKKNSRKPSLSESERENGCKLVNGYESIREQRIRENRERMEKLGVLSLSSRLFTSQKRNNSPSKNNMKMKMKMKSNSSVYESTRRSHRLKDAARTFFLESERSLKELGNSMPDKWTPEIYTEEDEKLLDDCVEKWRLEADGFGDDGDLLYDTVNGTACHQCRRKVLRKHTYCNGCKSGQGMLCGDCLYTRYGENVLEADQNPNWLCPACRGICNCSRCRRLKGWQPITIPYAKVVELGFKSVAHYLILNKRVGNMHKGSRHKTVMLDLTEEKSASPQHICSDTSAQLTEFVSDDSSIHVSKDRSKRMKNSAEKNIANVDSQAFNEVADSVVEKKVLQDVNSYREVGKI